MKTSSLILVLALTAAAAYADPDGEVVQGGAAEAPAMSGAPTTFERIKPFRFDIGAGFIGASDLDDAEGSVTTTRVLAELGALLPVADDDRSQGIAVSLRLVDSFFDFDDAGGFEPGTDDPFEEVRLIRLSASYLKQVDEEFSWFAGLGVDSAGERGASFSDTLRFSAFGAASWMVEENLKLGIGAIVNKRIGPGWRVYPIPVFDWDISDEWRLRSEARLDRFTVVLSYDVADSFALGAEIGYFGQRYRLEDDGPVAGGVFEERRLFTGIVGEWKISPAFSLIGVVGAQISGSFDLEDESSDRVKNTDLGAAPFAGLGLEIRF